MHFNNIKTLKNLTKNKTNYTILTPKITIHLCSLFNNNLYHQIFHYIRISLMLRTTSLISLNTITKTHKREIKPKILLKS